MMHERMLQFPCHEDSVVTSAEIVQATMILQVASSVEDINNHCIAFCKEFKVEVLHAARSRVSL